MKLKRARPTTSSISCLANTTEGKQVKHKKVIILTVVAALVALFFGLQHASANAEILTVDGTNYVNDVENGGTIQWNTPTPHPQAANYGDAVWGGNGAYHLEECGAAGVNTVHWVYTKSSGILVLSHVNCNVVQTTTTSSSTEPPDSTTSTTSTTQPPDTTTSTTVEPTTTTTVAETTTTVAPTTTSPAVVTTLPDPTTTTTVATDIITPPTSAFLVPDVLVSLPDPTTIPPAPSVGELPQTGIKTTLAWIAGIIVLAGAASLFISKRFKNLYPN
jgi:LPXTG-motif cell wall-anchored protein